MISIAPARAADIVLKASHNANQDEPYHSGMERMGELLKQKTGDKAEIQVFANAQLGDEMESVQGTQLGIVDIAVTANEVMANFAPDMSVFGLPYLFKDAEHMDRAVGSKQVHDQVDQILTAKGYRLLGIFFAGTRHIMSKRPIGSINDIKGMKIRTLNNPIHIEAFKSFGANPTPMPYTELYGALETGVVDGAEAANTNYHSRKFYEVAPNWAMTGWIEMVSPVVIGAAKFDSLPKDIQTALLEAGAEASKMERKVYRDSDQQRLAQLKQLKVNITHPDIEAFRSASQKIYESYVKTDGQKQLLQTIRTMD
ncbi:C4-dicarboxylate transporter [Advenella sp. S44]|nr:C4-dicarboxylate transporter [Advenella sp. S44]